MAHGMGHHHDAGREAVHQHHGVRSNADVMQGIRCSLVDDHHGVGRDHHGVGRAMGHRHTDRHGGRHGAGREAGHQHREVHRGHQSVDHHDDHRGVDHVKVHQRREVRVVLQIHQAVDQDEDHRADHHDVGERTNFRLSAVGVHR